MNTFNALADNPHFQKHKTQALPSAIFVYQIKAILPGPRRPFATRTRETPAGQMKFITSSPPGALLGGANERQFCKPVRADHQYHHKWAMLTNPRDLAAGARGYVKCNISVHAKGEKFTVPPETDGDDDIEGWDLPTFFIVHPSWTGFKIALVQSFKRKP